MNRYTYLQSVIVVSLISISSSATAEYFSGIGRSVDTNITPPLFATRATCSEFSHTVNDFMSALNEAHSDCLKVNKGVKPLRGGQCSSANCEDLHVLMHQRRKETSDMKRACQSAANENYKSSKILTFVSLNVALGTIDYNRYRGATNFLEYAVKATRVKDKCNNRSVDFKSDQCIGAVGDYVGHLKSFVQGNGVIGAIQDHSLGAITSHFQEMLNILDDLESEIAGL